MAAKKKGTKQAPVIPAVEAVPEEVKLTLSLTGTRGMMHHNARLANPLDPYTRRIKALTSKKKKTDQDLVEIARIEMRGGMYETSDGRIGLPAHNVWKCLLEASRSYKLGKEFERAVVDSPDVVPLVVDGQEWLCDAYVPATADEGGHLSFQSVKVGSSRVMRARPYYAAGWTAIVTFILNEDLLGRENLMPIVARAGRLIGLGEMRPRLGVFHADVRID